MKISDSPLYASALDHIQALTENSQWRAEADVTLRLANTDITDTQELLNALHGVQRLNRIAVAGLGDNEEFRRAYILQDDMPMWKEFNRLDVDLSLQKSLADKLYNIRPGMNDSAFIKVGESTYAIAEHLIERCQIDNAPFIVEFVDPNFQALLLKHTTNDGAKALADDFCAMTAPITRVITARENTSCRNIIAAPKEKAGIYNANIRPFHDRIGSGDLFYTLTAIPTRKDAAIDKIDYKEYLNLFFEMCDQPWDAIGRAQKSLIRTFNNASTVHITNNDGTDITMSLVDHDGAHFTFCNSLIAKNVPGSEIFSAPRRDSLNGVVVAKGLFGDAGEIKNLRMEFENGRMVRHSAEEGLDAFNKVIEVDEGAKWVGELGIGTNPHLKKHVANGLLVEKIGGSFHLALGHPYTYTEYGGEPVKVDNGNKSALHWDLTTMLHGKEGRIELDGKPVMENGRWIGKEYAVLNDGWNAIPKSERPVHWQNKAKIEPFK